MRIKIIAVVTQGLLKGSAKDPFVKVLWFLCGRVLFSGDFGVAAVEEDSIFFGVAVEIEEHKAAAMKSLYVLFKHVRLWSKLLIKHLIPPLPI